MFELVKKLMFARQISFEEGKIMLLNNPMLIMPVDTYVSLTKAIRDELGRKRGDDLIYKAMKKSAITYLNVLKKGFSMSKVDMIKWAANSVTLAGWGKVAVTSVDGQVGKAVIRVTGSTVGAGLGKDNESTDILLAGFFAGGESAVFGKNVDVKEVKCTAKGDPYCEFITI